MSDDPFVYPGTNVLKNRNGLRDADRLAQFEAQATAIRIAELALRPVQGGFDLDHLREVHRRIFGDVYPWAGQLRAGTGLMMKTRLGGQVVYGRSEHIPAEAERVFGSLRGEGQLLGLPVAALAGRLAHYYAELDAIHPFRDGNSRALRVFTTQLAAHGGHALDWRVVGQSLRDRDALYKARDAAVMTGNTDLLTAIVSRALGTGTEAGPTASA